MTPEPDRYPVATSTAAVGPFALEPEQLADLLAPHLPPGPVLVVESEGRSGAASLAARGVPITRLRDLRDIESGSGAAAVVLIDSLPAAASLPGVLGRARAALGDGGVLLLVESLAGDLAAPTTLRELDVVAALTEGGFVLRRVLPLGATTSEAGNAGVRGWGGEHRRLDGARAPELLVAARDGVRVRPYEAGDEEQILALFPRVFHVARSLAHWRWKYRDSPYGNLQISAALDPEDRLLCHYAGYPVPFRDFAAPEAASRFVGLQIGDTMSEPAARGIGRGETSLLARTARHFYARCCRGRVAFNYGFNTANIQKFSLRYVHARRVEDVAVLARGAAAPPPASPWPRWLHRLAGRSVRRVEAVDARYDRFFEEVGAHYGVLVARDARYLRWRYLGAPDVDYRLYAAQRRGRLTGWAVFRVQDDVLIWGDALVDPEVPEVAASLLAAALAEAGTRRVQGWFSPRPDWWIERLVALGFAPEAEPNGLALMMVPFLEASPETDLVPRLYYTQGDGDLF